MATATSPSSGPSGPSSNDANPFLRSLSSRRSQIDRTRNLLSVAKAPHHKRCETLALSPAERVALHPLTAKEIATLEGPHCRCKVEGKDGWTNVLAMRRTRGEAEGGCDASDWLRDNVSDTTFGGWVVLGVPPCCKEEAKAAAEEAKACKVMEATRKKFGTPGIRSNLVVRDSVLEYGCVVAGNGTVEGVHVGEGAALVNCGSVSFDEGGGNFEDGMEIAVGAESGGGREVNVTVESTLIEVCASLGMGRAATATKNEALTIPMNVLCPGSYVAHTPNVSSVYLSPHSYIDGATSASSAVLLPHSHITNSVTATSVLLQWNASVTTNSSVENAIVMEHSHVGPNSLVAHSILGPDVHVSAGEVHATILGPNTNAHHQSLLIGVLWPLGRGNVGYGANVGSNHTSRLPDQECASGEGTFWGLTTCIKMPVDLTSAPYSVVAAGSQVSPGQRVTMPFSLIVDGPAGATNILPGWVLYASPYTVSRSEAKFANRRKAKRHGHYTGWRIVRPGVIDLCVEARNALVAAAAGSAKGQTAGEAKKSAKNRVFKTDREVPGIGASHLSERSRLGGIRAYNDIVRLYALRGFLDRARGAWERCGKKNATGAGAASFEREMVEVVMGGADRWRSAAATTTTSVAKKKKAVEWPALPWEEPSFSNPDALWEHQLKILHAESPSLLSSSPPTSPVKTAVLLLRSAAKLEMEYAKRVRKSKSRDDDRGKMTVPGYAASHVAADDDAVVKDALRDATEAEEDVKRMEEALLLGSGDGGKAAAKSRL